MDLTTTQWLVLIFASTIYGFNKTGLVGSAIIATPLLLLNFTPGESLGIVLPLLIVADVVTVILLRESAIWSLIVQAMPWALSGVCLGWLIAWRAMGMEGMAGHVLLKRIIAGMLTIMVLFGYYLLMRRKRASGAREGQTPPETPEKPTTLRSNPWLSAGLGMLGGVSTMLANNGGPVWVTYLMPFRLTVKQFLGTAAWLFLILNVVKLPFGLQLGFVNAATLRLNLYLLPFLGAGLALGRVVAARIGKNAFDNVIQLLGLAGALYLLVA